MIQSEEIKPESLQGLFAHISRIYSSSINAAIAVIFGWLAFFGFCMGIQASQFQTVKPFLIAIGLTMFAFGGYFYLRIWIHGRYLHKMIIDLNLENYTETMITVTSLNRLNRRPHGKYSAWTWGEGIGLIFLVLSFLVPVMVLLFR